MNQQVHDAIVFAAEGAIRRSDSDVNDHQILEWRTVLRRVHDDMLRQSSGVLAGTMFETLINFRKHSTFDEWASEWRVKQFERSGRMRVDQKTGRPSFLFNDGPNTRDRGWFCGILSENPAFSVCHGEMLLKYEQYKNNLSGDLNLHSGVEVSTFTSVFLSEFIFMGMDSIDRLCEVLRGSDATNPLTMKTFMEYLIFLIDETDFTTPIITTAWGKYETTKRCMVNIDYPTLFNGGKNAVVSIVGDDVH